MGQTHNAECRMVFGRLSREGCCPRCDELRNGAEPRKGWGVPRRKRSVLREIREHDCAKSGCGPVCTAFDW